MPREQQIGGRQNFQWKKKGDHYQEKVLKENESFKKFLKVLLDLKVDVQVPTFQCHWLRYMMYLGETIKKMKVADNIINLV